MFGTCILVETHIKLWQSLNQQSKFIRVFFNLVGLETKQTSIEDPFTTLKHVGDKTRFWRSYLVKVSVTSLSDIVSQFRSPIITTFSVFLRITSHNIERVCEHICTFGGLYINTYTHLSRLFITASIMIISKLWFGESLQTRFSKSYRRRWGISDFTYTMRPPPWHVLSWRWHLKFLMLSWASGKLLSSLVSQIPMISMNPFCYMCSIVWNLWRKLFIFKLPIRTFCSH